ELSNIVDPAGIGLHQHVARRFVRRRVQRVESRSRTNLEHRPPAQKGRKNAEVTIQGGAAGKVRLKILNVLSNRRNPMSLVDLEERFAHITLTSGKGRMNRPPAR